ncbi:uncharacterized protein E6C27_scaffold128G00060 [Cucumis melo var. makuwa]|uniref:Reverse transcriptase domain-containing protein n=1 Tax=Cucumis melo var. makuwa TaxID=1194695 RepID=A0A5A7TD82_CUCMM|nr:uncharacterized protein E6C27_scaffold128G00060 [Cucumis melo var. makuwa]
MICLELIIGDLKASALFHVIDSRTTCKLLLGRPWIHRNGVVTSTLHQYFKFYQDGIKKVEADSNPFSEAESHFADAKFYLKNDSSSEVVSVEVPLVNREDNLQLKSLASRKPHKSTGTFHFGKGEASTSTTKKCPKGLKVGDIEVLKESFTTPLTKITKQEIKIDLTEASLPQRRTKDRFDPKSYKLMAKVGYDFTTHTEFKSLKIHEQPKLSSTQKKLLREGHAIPMSRKRLGYKSQEPIRITRKRKEKVVDNNHITVEEVNSIEEKEGDSQRTSAFDRISPHVAHAPVFERLSMTETERKDHRRLRDRGPHVQTASSIDTKKKESTSHTSVWYRIKHTDVESCHGKEFPCEVKRHDVILTNPGKEDSEQGEGEISCHHITILKELEIETPEEDAEDDPQSLEDGGQSTVDELKEVNFGTMKEPRPTFISPSLSSEEEGKYMSLLKEYKDIFAWSYKEIPRLVPKIEVEVNKLIEAGFIFEVKYPTWIKNIVPVRKKNGQLRVCVDFPDLNNACPKDDFPLPITKIMVDATTGHEELSFMDGSSGNNQIRMVLSDEEMTAFKTPKGIYCYKYVECYVDDLVVKSKRQQDHLKDLKVVFDRLRKYQLRMNPLKCAFGVTSEKFLGFVVRHREIEIDQSKIDVIQKMPRPKSLQDLRSLQGGFAYIRRFISNLAGRCQPFQKLMRKGENFVWDEACQNAFDSIKKYLFNPPEQSGTFILFAVSDPTSTRNGQAFTLPSDLTSIWNDHTPSFRFTISDPTSTRNGQAFTLFSDLTSSRNDRTSLNDRASSFCFAVSNPTSTRNGQTFTLLSDLTSSRNDQAPSFRFAVNDLTSTSSGQAFTLPSDLTSRTIGHIHSAHSTSTRNDKAFNFLSDPTSCRNDQTPSFYSTISDPTSTMNDWAFTFPSEFNFSRNDRAPLFYFIVSDLTSTRNDREFTFPLDHTSSRNDLAPLFSSIISDPTSTRNDRAFTLPLDTTSNMNDLTPSFFSTVSDQTSTKND